MKNANPIPPAVRKNPRGISIAGLLLLAAGLFMVRQLSYPASERIFPQEFASLLFLSPVVAVLGGALLLMGMFRFAASGGRADSLGSPRIWKWAGIGWRITIWVVAILTVFPWWWLSVLTRMSGGRPGNEGDGMGGTLIFLFIGLPALALAIFNEARLILNRHKRK
jgi:hypothetical protein